MARVLFTLGLAGLHLASVMSNVFLVALHLAWALFTVGQALFTFGLAGVHLANVLFTFGSVALHLVWVFFNCG